MSYSNTSITEEGASTYSYSSEEDSSFTGSSYSASTTTSFNEGNPRWSRFTEEPMSESEDSKPSGRQRARWVPKQSSLGRTPVHDLPGADSRTSTTSMLPLFHFTNQHTNIVALQHNRHFRLLAIITSDNEIFMCGTQRMPGMGESTFSEALQHCRDRSTRREDDASGGAGAGAPIPPLGDRGEPGSTALGLRAAGGSLEGEWDPALHTICIDVLPYPVTQLCWAPWQNGIYFAVLSPGRGLHFYRYAHSRWSREDILACPSASQMALAPVGYLCACACGRSVGIQVFGRGGPSGESEGEREEVARWRELRLGLESEPGEADGLSVSKWGAFHGQPSPSSDPPIDGADRDCVCVAWGHLGRLLSAAFRDGSIRIFNVDPKPCSTSLPVTPLLSLCSYMPPPAPQGEVGFAVCRHLSWAPVAGRSFLLLLSVYADGVVVSMFHRSRWLDDAAPVSPPRRMQTSLSANNSGKRQVASGPPASSVKLPHILSVPLHCSGVTHAEWNIMGSRFVTSHRDSTVNVWWVEISYPRRLTPSLQHAEGGALSMLGCDGEWSPAADVALKSIPVGSAKKKKNGPSLHVNPNADATEPSGAGSVTLPRIRIQHVSSVEPTY